MAGDREPVAAEEAAPEPVAAAEEPRGHVLVTGGAGYIGSTLTELLLHRGYEVTVLDRFFFGDTLADLRGDPRLRLVRGDVRWCDPSVFEGVDAVCDLAALSNDPAGELDPEKTLEINHRGRARVCRLAKEAGATRYVLASSCSTYGFQDDVVDETSPINPLTTYAKANRLAEESALALADDGYTVTCLRQATVFGLSRRMRYDLMVNGMTWALHKFGQVKVMRDGTQWRPIVHVRDTSRAFATVLEADPGVVQGEIFNVGHEDLNVQILDTAKRVTEACGHEFELEWYGDPDHRSYRVAFGKIQDALGFHPEWTVADGAREIYQAFEDGRLDPDDPKARTVGWYKSLLDDSAGFQKEVLLDGVVL